MSDNSFELIHLPVLAFEIDVRLSNQRLILRINILGNIKMTLRTGRRFKRTYGWNSNRDTFYPKRSMALELTWLLFSIGWDFSREVAIYCNKLRGSVGWKKSCTHSALLRIATSFTLSPSLCTVSPHRLPLAPKSHANGVESLVRLFWQVQSIDNFDIRQDFREL